MISRIQWYYIVVQCFYTVISLETKTKMRFHSLLTEDKQSTSITVTQSKRIRVLFQYIKIYIVCSNQQYTSSYSDTRHFRCESEYPM
jgi:hypothetical protein